MLQNPEKRMSNSKYILPVFTQSAEVLKKHTKGPGTRYVFCDHENNPEGQVYVIVRVVNDVDCPEQHVEDHSHEVDSLWLFEGIENDLTGLQVEVKLGDEWYVLNSPASVYIPAGLMHNYRFIKGSGKYTNIVMAKGGDYNTITQ